MIVLFIILVVGYIANKTKIMDAGGNKSLTRLILAVNQTALILGSVMNVEDAISPGEIGIIILASVGMYALLGILSIGVPYLLHTKPADRGIYRFMTMFGNVGFMGYPVIGALFGQEAIFYAAVFNIPFYVFIYSIGIILVKGGDKSFRFDFKVLLNAPLISSILSIGIYLLRINFPLPIVEAATSLGNMTTPGAMLILGSSLALIPLKKVFGDWRSYVFSLVRLIILPIVSWLVFKNLITDQLLLGIVVVVSGMPVATNATMVCMQYGGNEEIASKTVVLSTIFSVATIPLMVYLLLA